MALPWGAQNSSQGSLSSGSVEVKIVPFEQASSSRSLLSMFRPTPRFSTVDGVTVGAPGAPYQITVAVREQNPAAGGRRVILASIDGREINEQLVLSAGDRHPLRFVGWLDSADGTKRIQFCFPATGEAVVQVGVFEATASGGSDKKGGMMRAPDAALGAGFQGPAVSNQAYTLGQPVAIGSARLRAE